MCSLIQVDANVGLLHAEAYTNVITMHYYYHLLSSQPRWCAQVLQSHKLQLQQSL